MGQMVMGLKAKLVTAAAEIKAWSSAINQAATLKTGFSVATAGIQQMVMASKGLFQVAKLVQFKVGIDQLRLFKLQLSELKQGFLTASTGAALFSLAAMKLAGRAALGGLQFTLPIIGKGLMMFGSAVGKLTAGGFSMVVKLGEALGNVVNKVAALGTGIALAAAAGLAAWTKSAISAVAESTKLATRLGMTTEAFQKLSYAAKLSGMDSETLANNLAKMEERLAEVASAGTGPAAEALKKFGLSAEKLVAMGPEKAFMTLAGVIERLPTSFEKLQVAKEIFGKSGEGMVNLAMQGTENLKKMGMEATNVGFAMNGINNEKVFEANQGLVKVGLALQGIGNQIAVVLAPYITAISDQFVQWTTSTVKGGNFMSQAVKWVTDSIKFAADAVQLFRIAWDALNAVVYKIFQKMAEGLAWISQKLIDFGKSSIGKQVFEKMGIDVQGFEKGAAKQKQFFEEWAKDLGKISDDSWEKMKQKWSKPWWSIGVGKFLEQFKFKMDEKAEFNAKKRELLQTGGEGGAVTPRPVETKFASGAAEAGTVEGRSAILQAKTRQMDMKLVEIAGHTARTADATTRTAIAVERARDAAGGIPGPEGQQFRAAVAGS